MRYPEAIQFLYELQWFGTKLGLENTFELARRAGNPQERLRFIHVAGTNGKGSTCAMLESIYRAAGLRVGLFTSPHLMAFGERIQVNRQPICPADVVRLVGELRHLLHGFPLDAHPTFFEVVTVMALRYFEEQNCDLVIWETGMGGRLDATNIVTPLASVITNIQYDHQKWLGNSLEQIAFEKAGIIKPQVPVITAVEDPGAFRVLFRRARECQAPFWLITLAQADVPPLSDLELPLPGIHQRVNAALAVQVARVLSTIIPVNDGHIRAGLTSVQWAGRLQIIDLPNNRRVILDGAHNIGGAEALRSALQSIAPAGDLTFILGILQDKDYTPICNLLAPLASRIVATPVSSQRTAQPREVAAASRLANPHATVEEAGSIREALERTERDPLRVVSGSLYLIGEAMEWLGLGAQAGTSERGLNEWGGNTPVDRKSQAA